MLSWKDNDASTSLLIADGRIDFLSELSANRKNLVANELRRGPV